jgi:hypothetical protein
VKIVLISALFLASMTTTGAAAERLGAGDGATRLSDAQLEAVTASIKDLGVFFLPEPANRIPYDQVILIVNPGTDRLQTSDGIVQTAQQVGGLGRLSKGQP